MHTFNGTAVAVLQIFALITLGWIIARIKTKTEGKPDEAAYPKVFWDKLARLVYVLFVPPLILKTLLQAQWKDEHLHFALATAIGSALATIVSVILARIFLGRLDLTKMQKNTLLAVVFQPNCVFLGFPLIAGVIGEHGLEYAGIFGAVEWPIVTIPSILILQGGTQGVKAQIMRKIIRDPLMIVIAVGIPWSIFHLPFPEIAVKPMEMLGHVAAPAALVVVGARLALTDLGRHASGIAWASVVKLVAIPLVMYGFAVLFGLTGVTRQVFTLLMACPIAAGMTIIVGANNGDVELCANATSVTTIASLATLIVAATLLT